MSINKLSIIVTFMIILFIIPKKSLEFNWFGDNENEQKFENLLEENSLIQVKTDVINNCGENRSMGNFHTGDIIIHNCENVDLSQKATVESACVANTTIESMIDNIQTQDSFNTLKNSIENSGIDFSIATSNKNSIDLKNTLKSFATLEAAKTVVNNCKQATDLTNVRDAMVDISNCENINQAQEIVKTTDCLFNTNIVEDLTNSQSQHQEGDGSNNIENKGWFPDDWIQYIVIALVICAIISSMGGLMTAAFKMKK